MPTDLSHSSMVFGAIVFSLIALVHEKSSDPHQRRLRFASLLFLGTLAVLIGLRVLGLLEPV